VFPARSLPSKSSAVSEISEPDFIVESLAC
jgi:hypothetical protein